MSAFLFTCAGLVLLSGLFYLFPSRRSGKGLPGTRDANLEWYRLRQAELAAEGGEALGSDVDLRLLEDDALSVDPADTTVAGHFPRWVLLPAVALIAGVLYYKLGAAPDVIINRQLQALTEASPAEQIQAVQASIETRAAQRPENLHYRALLGRFYMGQQDYSRAATLYGGLAEAAPGDSQALAYAAQSEYLASGRVLSPRAQMFAEQALAIDPHQRTALGLLGMASFEQEQYRAAIEYWQRLLAMETPGSESAQMIAGVIERANEKLGVTGGGAVSGGVDTVVTEAVSAGVSVRVSLPPGAQVSPGDTVFVLARGADATSRMPVAVQRLQVAQLPITLRLDDSKSMAGQKLSTMESVVVVVQVSPDGAPGEANATWLGAAGPVAPSSDTSPLEIVLSPK